MDTIRNTTNLAHQIAFDAHQILVRPVQEDEINCVADIITHSFHFDRGWRGWFTPLFKLGIAEDLRHRLRTNVPNHSRTPAPQQVCSIAVYTERGVSNVVGTIEVGIRTNHERSRVHHYAYISNLAVSSDFRRRGVACELLTECEQITLTWGYTELYLHVMADNTNGRNLYHRAGYVLVSSEFMWSLIPWKRPQRLFLKKQLT